MGAQDPKSSWEVSHGTQQQAAHPGGLVWHTHSKHSATGGERGLWSWEAQITGPTTPCCQTALVIAKYRCKWENMFLIIHHVIHVISYSPCVLQHSLDSCLTRVIQVRNRDNTIWLVWTHTQWIMNSGYPKWTSHWTENASSKLFNKYLGIIFPLTEIGPCWGIIDACTEEITTHHQPPNLLNLFTVNNLSRLYFHATMGILPWIHKRRKYSFIYLHTILFLLLLWFFVVF